MGFLHRLFQKFSGKKQSVPKTSMPKKTLDEIWQLEDPSDLIGELSVYIAVKCHYEENLSVLSVPERIFYTTQTLEEEVNNGGFDQFFFNSSGNLANEVVHAFTEIGAVKTADICRKAFSVYGEEVPADRDERQDILELLNEEQEEILERCADVFFDYEENLNELNYAFVMRNKNEFC